MKERTTEYFYNFENPKDNKYELDIFKFKSIDRKNKNVIIKFNTELEAQHFKILCCQIVQMHNVMRRKGFEPR